MTATTTTDALHLDLLKHCLLGSVYGASHTQVPIRHPRSRVGKALTGGLRRGGVELSRTAALPCELFEEGRGEPWSVVRGDGDRYESTMDALENLYPSSGGYPIVDYYGCFTACRQAVNDRDAHGIQEQILQIDWTGVYWQREA